jgi:SAM-dependent methyltransferase
MVDRYVLAAHWCKGKRVLDAACGHGYGSAILLALGAEEVLGVDTDPAGLEYARSHYAGPRVDFRRFDLIGGEPGSLGSFEVVVSVETMEHLPREAAGKYLERLRSHVAPGGTVLVTTPRRTGAEFRYRGGTHRHEYSAAEFEAALRSAFPGSRISFLGIDEFRVHDEPRLYSRLTTGIDERARIMVALVEDAGGGL